MSLVPWIKIEHTLPDKPEVIRIAAELRIDQDAVTGKLLRLWIWADQNTIDGGSLTITAAFIDRMTGCKKFAQAMRAAGWLEGEDGAMTFPGFARHNGATAKARAESNRRMTKTRQTRKQGGGNVAVSAQQKPQPEEEEEEDIRAQSALVQRAAQLVPRINFLRPDIWNSPELNKSEKAAAIDNLAVLEAFPDSSWQAMGEYLNARHPEGSGAWVVQIRLKFLESPNDLESRALAWKRKQKDRKPAPTPAPLPAEKTEEDAKAVSEFLSLPPGKLIPNPAA